MGPSVPHRSRKDSVAPSSAGEFKITSTRDPFVSRPRQNGFPLRVAKTSPRWSGNSWSCEVAFPVAIDRSAVSPTYDCQRTERSQEGLVERGAARFLDRRGRGGNRSHRRRSGISRESDRGHPLVRRLLLRHERDQEESLKPVEQPPSGGVLRGWINDDLRASQASNSRQFSCLATIAKMPTREATDHGPEGVESLGDAARARGDVAEAVEVYLEAARHREVPQPELCLKLADSYYESKEPDLAFLWLRRLVDSSDAFTSWMAAAAMLDKLTELQRPSARRKVRAAVTGTYTTTQLVAMLRVAALRADARPYGLRK